MTTRPDPIRLRMVKKRKTNHVSRADALKRVDQRARRERLRSRTPAPRGELVVAGHVDDRHGTSSSFETKPQINARSVVVQVDIEEDVKALFEVAVIFESLRSRKQDAGYPNCRSSRLIPSRVATSSWTTKTMSRSGNVLDLVSG